MIHDIYMIYEHDKSNGDGHNMDKKLSEERRGKHDVETLTWKQVTISHTELDFDVHSISILPFDERCPQPVIDIIVSHITNYI